LFAKIATAPNDGDSPKQQQHGGGSAKTKTKNGKPSTVAMMEVLPKQKQHGGGSTKATTAWQRFDLRTTQFCPQQRKREHDGVLSTTSNTVTIAAQITSDAHPRQAL